MISKEQREIIEADLSYIDEMKYRLTGWQGSVITRLVIYIRYLVQHDS